MAVRRLRVLVPADVAELTFDCPCGIDLAPDTCWARAAMDRWGFCGVAEYRDGRPVAWLLVAPAIALPARHPLVGRSRRSDSAVLVAVHVDEALRGHGSGRHLVQAVCARLLDQARCIEAAARTAHPRCDAPPLAWLEAVGFELVTEATSIASTPRVRLDLKRSVRSRLRRAVGRLAQRAWSPVPAPVRPEPSRRVGADR